MKNKNNKKIIWIGLIISLFFFSIFIFTKNINLNQTSPSLDSSPSSNNYKIENEKIKKIEIATLEINEKTYESEITGIVNIYELMEKLQNEEKINFKEKTYPGMGKFIEEINGIKNGEKYWIYYVNGEKANIGISNYKIKAGDVVSWKYE